ncbi:MAG: hypothetical protein ACETWK_08495 [Candidatus Aminicenantaceae bacterium]
MRKSTSLLISIFFIAFSILNAEEEKKKSFEIFAFANVNFSAVNTTYQNNFELDFDAAKPGSYASQILTLQGKAREGFNAGFTYFMSEKFGIKFSLNYSRNLLSGENSPYKIYLKYISIHPPDYVPHEVTYDETYDWLTTQGNLKTFSFFTNLQYRFVISKNTTASFSAGSGFYRVYGNFNPLGYSEFWLGGHGVLFSEHYLVMLKIPSSGKIGFNTDFELNFRLSKNFSFAAKLAYNLCGNISIIPVIDKVLFYPYLGKVAENKLSKIKDQMKLKSLKINPSFLSLNFGIKYSLNI